LFLANSIFSAKVLIKSESSKGLKQKIKHSVTVVTDNSFIGGTLHLKKENYIYNNYYIYNIYIIYIVKYLGAYF